MLWFIKMAHSLKNIAMLNTKGATFRCLLIGIGKNKGLKRFSNIWVTTHNMSSNSVTYDKGV